MTGGNIKSNAKATLPLGGPQERILKLLRAEPYKPYNPSTIAYLLNLEPRTVRAILHRLTDSGRICKLARGQYAARDQVRLLLQRRVAARDEGIIHNLTLILPLPEMLLSTDRPLRRGDTPRNHPAIDEFAPLPDQKVRVTYGRNKIIVTVRASKDPLTPKDFLWLVQMLRERTGYDFAEARVVRLDINLDVPTTLSPNEYVARDVGGLCLSIYRKGGFTRAELRNWNPHQQVKELVEHLRSTIEPPRRPEPASPLARDDEGAMFR